MDLPEVVFRYPGKPRVCQAGPVSSSAVLSELYFFYQSVVGFSASPVGASILPCPPPTLLPQSHYQQLPVLLSLLSLSGSHFPHPALKLHD